MPARPRTPKTDAAPAEPTPDATTEPTTEPAVDAHTAELLAAPPRFAAAADIDSGLLILPAPPELTAFGLVRVMPRDEYAARLARLSAPFPRAQMEKLPRQLQRNDDDKGRCERGAYVSADGYYCGGWHARSVHLDYVGHAGVTMRLLEVDPLWSYRFLHADDTGAPIIEVSGSWIELTVLGITRLGFGDAQGKSGPNAIKEVIGDALRNAALRFGVATYMWSKSEDAQILKAGGEIPTGDAPVERPNRTTRSRGRAEQTRPDAPAAATPAVAATPAEPAMSHADAIAMRTEVLTAIDWTAPGPQRDALLRPLYDLVEAGHGLGNLVPVPEPWRHSGATECTLGDLITGGRAVRIPSGETADPRVPEPDDEHDPWATPAPTEEQQS